MRAGRPFARGAAALAVTAFAATALAATAFAATALAVALTACTGSSSSDREVRSETSAATATLKDALILSAVKARITVDEPDTTTHVGVAVKEGVVTLRGRVRDFRVRDKLVADAQMVPDVKSVVNEIRLDPAQERLSEQSADLLLSGRLHSAIAAEVGFQTGLDVDVQRGVVTFGGSVHDAKTHAAILAVARNMSGVRNVVDKMRVGGP